MCIGIKRGLSWVAAVGMLLSPLAISAADYLWMEPAAGGIQVNYGTLDGKQLPMAEVSGLKASQGDAKDLPLQAEGKAMKVSSSRSGDVRVVGYRVTPEGTLVLFQAKEGRSETKPVNDLELVPTTANGNTFQLIWKGQKVAIPQARLTTSELGWNRVLRPDAEGNITLSTPFPATYVLDLSAKLNGSTTIEGKTYKDVLHTVSLSFKAGPNH